MWSRDSRKHGKRLLKPLQWRSLWGHEQEGWLTLIWTDSRDFCWSGFIWGVLIGSSASVRLSKIGKKGICWFQNPKTTTRYWTCGLVCPEEHVKWISSEEVVINVMSYLCSWGKMDASKVLSSKMVHGGETTEVPHWWPGKRAQRPSEDEGRLQLRDLK